MLLLYILWDDWSIFIISGSNKKLQLTQEDFHGAFQKLLERYNKCIAAGGDYFEGD